jgi:hypothetical protein
MGFVVLKRTSVYLAVWVSNGSMTGSLGPFLGNERVIQKWGDRRDRELVMIKDALPWFGFHEVAAAVVESVTVDMLGRCARHELVKIRQSILTLSSDRAHDVARTRDAPLILIGKMFVFSGNNNLGPIHGWKGVSLRKWHLDAAMESGVRRTGSVDASLE